jgi:Domain of unknown function (DUF5658)
VTGFPGAFPGSARPIGDVTVNPAIIHVFFAIHTLVFVSDVRRRSVGMVCKGHGDPQSVRNQSPLDAVTNPARESSCGWTTRTRWQLFALFTGLQIADVVTTNDALAIPGNWELNPIMRLSQADFGAAWWLPKAVAVGVAAAVMVRAERQWPLILSVSYYILIVIGNLACL